MIKTNPTLKESINLADKIKMTTELADSYFMQDKETGEWKYTPYFADINTITAFFLYCVDGVEFEPARDEDDNILMDEDKIPFVESVYDSVIGDEEMFRLYTGILDAAQTDEKDIYEAYPYKTLLTQFLSVLSDTADMVDYRKQQLLHQRRDSVDEFFATLTEAIQSIDFDSVDLSKLIPADKA